MALSLSSPDQTFEDLDPPGFLGTESLQILRFVTDRAKLNDLSSRGSWPDYSRI
jgi:hypothetical protein